MSELHLPPHVIERLRTARSITALTGGVLAYECGVPGFRQAQAADERWASLEPQELATAEAFLRNPRLVWEWFSYRRALSEAATPGPAFYALVDLEQIPQRFKLITQAVDGMHWRAGSRELLELHGSLARTRCFDEGTLVESWDERESPPRCADCSGYLRPDVVLYGEGVPAERIREADAATICDVFFCIGTDSVVQPAASLPLHAKRNGAFVIEISPKPSAFTIFADFALHGSPAALLPALVALLES